MNKNTMTKAEFDEKSRLESLRFRSLLAVQVKDLTEDDRKFLWFDLETVEEVLEDKYTLKQINNLKVGTLLKNLDNFDLGF
jgi:hypothetical protein|tara:strand:+ start:854 stop:1096 length:243 start_codon:yes stop_codon:yes gene_type:complete